MSICSKNNLNYTVNISDFVNQSLAYCLDPKTDNGLYSKVSLLHASEIELIDKANIYKTLVDKYNYLLLRHNITESFTDGYKTLENIVLALPSTIIISSFITTLTTIIDNVSKNTLAPNKNTYFIAYTLGTILLLTIEAFVTFKFNDKYQAYNAGFSTQNVRNGRSFIQDYTNQQLVDSSYNELLKQMSQLECQNIDEFYRTVLDFMLYCKNDNIANLNSSDEFFFTNFFTVYIAEAIRFASVSYAKYYYPNHSLQILFMIPYINSSNRIIDNGKLVNGTANDIGLIYSYNAIYSNVALGGLILEYVGENYPTLIDNLYNVVIRDFVNTDQTLFKKYGLFAVLINLLASGKGLDILAQHSSLIYKSLSAIFTIMRTEHTGITNYIIHNIHSYYRINDIPVKQQPS